VKLERAGRFHCDRSLALLECAARVLALSCATFVGCAVPKQMLAASDDLADYRAFRVAAHEGTRLARAQAYLRRHPRGVWADEVRLAFETEEPAWFEEAKNSRTRAREYLIDLPRGPHADAAHALLLVSVEHDADIDMIELLTAAQHTSAMLDLEAERRRRVGEVVLEELSVLIDQATWRASLDDPPHALAAVLRGSAPHTWGSGPKALRQDDFFFTLPTPNGSEARVAQVRLLLALDRGRVNGGRIEGEDLFVHWAEADETQLLDATSPTDRAAAATYLVDVLAGALEARFPGSRCWTRPRQREILVRACDGWRASASMGARPGDDDVITVRGPRE
jgi:hypothetical protein